MQNPKHTDRLAQLDRHVPPYTPLETLRSLKRHAPSTPPPITIPLQPSPKPFLALFAPLRDMPSALPRSSLCCTVSPKIAHSKAFLELAWAHVGPRWLKIALNYLFEHPKRSKNNLGKFLTTFGPTYQ